MLSFGVLIAFLSPKKSEIEESSLESISKSRIQGVWDPTHSTRTGIIAHSTRVGITSDCRHYIRLPPLSTRMYHIRNSAAAVILPECSHPKFCYRCHSTRMFTSEILLPPTFHLDVSHPADISGWEKRAFQLPRSDISGSTDSAHPESFAANFAQCRGVLLKLPDMSNRHFEIFFCTVPRCSPEASRYLRPTFWDILRYFALDICCLNSQNLLVTHQL